MKTTNANQPEATASTCIFCGEAIVEGHWFARIRDGQERVIFCRPRCVVQFLNQCAAETRPEFAAGLPHANGNNGHNGHG